MRARFKANEPGPCVQVPVIVFPSADILPSYLPPILSIANLNSPSAKLALVAAMAWPP
ncbi:MAG TPA: hypothetical protein VGG45_17545 [Terracidiphilus sp.]